MVKGHEFTTEEKKKELEAYIKVSDCGYSIHIIVFELPFNLARK